MAEQDHDPPIFATADPTLWPHMLLPRPWRSARPFPFSDERTRYTYFARNAIYHLVPALDLVGREVLFPAYFHNVELQALIAGGAVPRFFPVGAGMRVDPAEVVARITPQTRAIYLIHYAGFPGPVEELARVCRERGLLLIEDCALALLSRAGDRPLGSFGDAAVFCIYKAIPTPNGGAVVGRAGAAALPPPTVGSVTSGVSLAAFSLLRNLEVRTGTPGRLVRRAARAVGRRGARATGLTYVTVGTQDFDLAEVPYKISGVTRWIIRTQDYDRIVARRRRNYARLAGALADIAPPVLGDQPDGVCPLFYPIAVPDKREVQAALRRRGVEAVNFWETHHPALPAGSFPEVDRLRRTVLEVPCHQDLDDGDVDRIASAVRAVLAARR